VTEITSFIEGLPTPVVGLIGSFLAGAMSGVGALGVFLVKRRSPRIEVVLLGFSAGIMLAATSFSLVIPGIDAALSIGLNRFSASMIISAGLLIGGAALWFVHRYAPHEHFIKGPEGRPTDALSRMWLFTIAITLHNFPEGLAVGVGFGGEKVETGVPLAIAIGIQNVPEGFVVALALATEGYTRGRAAWIGILTGMAEPVGGLIGATMVTLAAGLLPWGMAFAAGAMLFVISGEIIPETHREGRSVLPTFGILVGFVVMMVLDLSLG
jgi:ZIP family zinc transporter